MEAIYRADVDNRRVTIFEGQQGLLIAISETDIYCDFDIVGTYFQTNIGGNSYDKLIEGNQREELANLFRRSLEADFIKIGAREVSDGHPRFG